MASSTHTSGPAQPLPDDAALSVHNAREEIDRVEEGLLEAMARHGFGEAAKFAVRLALEEGIVNAFKHGHKGLAPSVPVNVRYAVKPGRIEIVITDQGPGYQPQEIPDPTLEENLEKPSGRGLMLIKSFMSEVHHELGGRRLVMAFVDPG